MGMGHRKPILETWDQVNRHRRGPAYLRIPKKLISRVFYALELLGQSSAKGEIAKHVMSLLGALESSDAISMMNSVQRLTKAIDALSNRG